MLKKIVLSIGFLLVLQQPISIEAFNFFGYEVTTPKALLYYLYKTRNYLLGPSIGTVDLESATVQDIETLLKDPNNITSLRHKVGITYVKNIPRENIEALLN